MLLANDKKGNSDTIEKQVVSKQRVADHGEVYTGRREVNAMLDLVKQETERIESKFLEPACGTGNFVTEILERKLSVVSDRYGKSQLDWERNAVSAVSSIYGIDIQEDNVNECRSRLFQIFQWRYNDLFNTKAREGCRCVVRFIIEKNIIWGDALTLKTVGEDPHPIVFAEWSLVSRSMFKRRDFVFQELIPDKAHPLFSANHPSLCSDLGDEAFIPLPVKEYPLTHFMRLADAEQKL